MYSFEGNYKSKRSLVLDHTQKLSTHALVQKTREERKSRENMVKQERAATKIQKCLRDYVARNKMKRYFIELLNELSKQLDDIINKTGFNLLQCFNTCYRNKSPEQKHLFTVCRLLLSKHGKNAQVNWLTNGSVDHIFTLGNSLLINIKYLTKLPSLTTSSNYTLPIRVLEELFNILIGTCSSTKISLYSKQLYFSIEWICRHLSKHHYFNHLAYFMDQQLPTTTGGYLKDFTTQSQVFDPVEFFKLPKTRSFINLIIAPLKCTFNLSDNGSPFSNPMVDFYRELVFTALNDILISTIDDHNTYIIGERVILSVGMEMFKLPNLHQIVIHGCLTAVENENSQLNTEQQRQQPPHNGTISLIPSINLLHLFVTVAIPGMLVKCDPTTTTSSSTVHTTESSMIQDTDDDDNHEEAVTEEEGGDESLPVLLATESYTHYTWSGSPLEAAITIRFVARILMSCLTEPHLPIVRPITDPKPLQLRIGQGEELSDDDDGDDDDNKINDNHNRMKGVEINDQEMNMSAEFTRSTNNCSLISEAVSFQPVWASQLTKISASLSHSLPALAASSLSTLENFNSDLDNPDKLELIRSSSYLHYCLSQVCGLSRTSLIRINSIYSQYTIYLRCLWKLIENTKCLNKSTLNYSNTNMSTLFNILCSGELPTHLVELQSYLPLIFTFADCLHHRLLCLTDSEICDISSEVNYTNSNDYRHQQPINNNSEPSRGGCGFRADELLQVGARLRDLMLGLIDLSHPDQVPKQTRNLQTDTHCVESMEQPNYGAVLRRIEQWVEIADLGSSPIGDLMMRNYTQWSIPDFRLLLYCWCSLLRRVERLVFQIYDWDRRCRRQQDTSLPIYLLQNPQSTTTTASTNASSTFSSSSSSTDIARVTNSPRLPLGTPSLSQTFWLKDNLFDLLNTTESQSSWFENHGYQNTLALAGAPFGYYSILNPDRNQESFSLSNRQIRQVLLLKKVPFVIPFEKRVKYTIYLRCLWKLIENTKCLNKSTLNYSNSNMSTLFNILCSGELPTHLVELQSYLPLIFTFADCLHHRLLCLTDSEICDISSEVNYTNSNDYRHQQPINNNSEPSRGGCGFRADELLQVGARLRDLMLGLIDLSHPDQVPKQTRCNLQTDTHCVESMEQPNYGAVLRRIEQWVEIADLGSSPIGDLMMRNYTQWSIPDFRLLLYCWCSLLRRVERLVFQIYDWDRRCRRQQDTSLPIYLLQNPQSTTTTASTNASSTFSSSSSSTDIARVTNSPRLPLGTPSLSQTFWLKDNLFDLLNTTESQTSWFENQGYQSTLALAGAPFGYYSILNPDRNQESFSLSNRQIRQVLLLRKVPFVIPFEKRVKVSTVCM
ncbi:unnamed protein product [Schistosoma intercalatum]|nr:unnamed protein product [Schistosoma intercalatum]